jgi:hypothetical protein
VVLSQPPGLTKPMFFFENQQNQVVQFFYNWLVLTDFDLFLIKNTWIWRSLIFLLPLNFETLVAPRCWWLGDGTGAGPSLP